MSVEALPTDERAIRHKWGDPVRIAGHDTHDGNDRTERTCALCKIVKITVHPPVGNAWREWRTKDGMTAVLTMTPPCLGGNP